MKTRVISAAVAIALLLVIAYLGSIAIGLAIFLLAMAATYEFYRALERGGSKPIYFLGYIACLPLLYLALEGLLPTQLTDYVEKNCLLIAATGFFVLLVVLFCFSMFSDGKYKIADISITLFGILYIAFLFSFVTLTRKMENGNLYVWLIFIGASATDTFAFFTGITIGKTKIIPRISPKKSLEGCIGGVIGAVLAMLAFGSIFMPQLGTSLIHFAILGLLCGVISQIGDWSASSVKRAVGIKDYGNIMPGHGGVLDRLDSILFVAPTVYFYINLFFQGV
ncbi:MAG: phosphatidate cytidylyltransferase [Clostridiaceae bacterium]|jgi:phosphatidate cytidylyltransferase|nr:phosphatidate cytidylyltransferase [Clostridiaceae bacterium]